MSGEFRTSIEPERLLRLLGVLTPCPACVRELGEGLSYLANEVDDEDLQLCWMHLMDLPSALQDAMRETAKLPEEARRRAERGRPTTAEMESASQWSAHLGRFIGPRQRIDALAELRRR